MSIYLNHELLLRVLNDKSKDFKSSLKEIEDEFNGLAEWIVNNLEKNFKNVVFRNFLNAAINYIKIARNCNGLVKLLAFCAHNLYELYLVSSYVSQNPANIQNWYLEAHRDEKDIISSLIHFLNSIEGASNHSEHEISALKQRQNEKEKKFEKNGLNLPKKRMADLAKNRLSEKIDYDYFYKIFSKLLHPTSYLVNSSAEEIQNDSFRNFLEMHIQLFSLCIFKGIKKELNFNECSVKI